MIPIIDSICYLDLDDFIACAWLDNELILEIQNCARLFKIKQVPKDMIIVIHVLNEIDFKQKKEKMNLDECVTAFTEGVKDIYFPNINGGDGSSIDYDLYKKQIIHECIHAFQAYYSLVTPSEYIWLYESVACYLAGQKIKRRSNNRVSWYLFVHSFYYLEDCYAIAYLYGKALFDSFGKDALVLLKQPQLYWNEFEQLYLKIDSN